VRGADEGDVGGVVAGGQPAALLAAAHHPAGLRRARPHPGPRPRAPPAPPTPRHRRDHRKSFFSSIIPMHAYASASVCMHHLFLRRIIYSILL